jgi:ubiquinone/menaquinone biosynthesis C-methylase UbiE
MGKMYNEMSYVEVAARYNDINHIPPAASEALGRATAELVGENASILDFGAGAGRISVPIARYSNMIALDIEHHMQQACRKLAEEQGISLTHSVGTVLQLPFANDTFDAVITSNVLHQIDEWRDALGEAARVLKPDGLFIIGRDLLDEESCAGKMRSASRRFTAEIAPEFQPTDAAGPVLFQHIGQLGGRPGQPVTACEWTETESPRSVLDKMADRLHNETWSLDDEKLDGLMELMNPWTQENFPDLDREEEIQWQFALYPITGMAA